MPEIAGPLGGAAQSGGFRTTDLDNNGAFLVEPLPFDTTQAPHPPNRSVPRPGDPCHPLARGGRAPAVAFQWPVDASTPIRDGEVVGAICAKFSNTLGASEVDAGLIIPVAPALTATNDPSRSPQSAEMTQQVAAVHSASHAVRRLTPRECERLQGFPDDYTLIEYRGKPASDGPRYKALGNSMAVNVMRWIGARIAQYESEGVVADLRAVSEELRELVGSVEALVELDATQRDALREVLEEVRRRRFALRDALNAAELAEKALLLKIPGLSGP